MVACQPSSRAVLKSRLRPGSRSPDPAAGPNAERGHRRSRWARRRPPPLCPKPLRPRPGGPQRVRAGAGGGVGGQAVVCAHASDERRLAAECGRVAPRGRTARLGSRQGGGVSGGDGEPLACHTACVAIGAELLSCNLVHSQFPMPTRRPSTSGPSHGRLVRRPTRCAIRAAGVGWCSVPPSRMVRVAAGRVERARGPGAVGPCCPAALPSPRSVEGGALEPRGRACIRGGGGQRDAASSQGKGAASPPISCAMSPALSSAATRCQTSDLARPKQSCRSGRVPPKRRRQRKGSRRRGREGVFGRLVVGRGQGRRVAGKEGWLEGRLGVAFAWRISGQG